MRLNLKWLVLLVCLGISTIFLGCSRAGANRSVNTESEEAERRVAETEKAESDEGGTEGMRAVITINGTEYGMTITDTTVGRAFAKKLEAEGGYSVSGSRAADDICCSESESLETDTSENMPWVCGDVAWPEGWFTIWVDKDPAGYDMPVIARIDEEYLTEIQALNGRMEISVRLGNN